jgi:hypothetical protein
MTVDEFAYSHKAEKFNVALCLGAVNFGTLDEIRDKLTAIIGMLRRRDARIYFRFYTVPPKGAPADFFPWTYELVGQLAREFDFEIMGMAPDADATIFAEWWSNNRSVT